MSEFGNATDAQRLDFQPPFRVEKTGFAKSQERATETPSKEQLDAQIAVAGTAGAVVIDSEIEIVA